MVERRRGVRTRSMVSVAILRTQFDRSAHDYIDCFVPFAVDCIKSMGSDAISLPEVVQCIYYRFQLNVPLSAMKTILHRTNRKGYITSHGQTYTPTDKLRHTPLLEPSIRSIERSIEALVIEFQEYARSQHGMQWDRPTCEYALLTRLAEDMPTFLGAAVAGRPIPQAGRNDAREAVIVNNYLCHIYAADPAAFSTLETLIKGTALASALVLPVMGEATRRFDALRMYFDSGLLIRSLGLEGEVHREATLELLALLRDLGAQTLCHSRTAEEVRRVLRVAARALREAATESVVEYGPTIRYLIENRYDRSRLISLIGGLEDALLSIGITVSDEPRPEPAEALDEPHLRKVLGERVRYRTDAAVTHDVEMIRLMHSLRSGDSVTILENCRAIFVTSHTGLVDAAAELQSPDLDAIPYCIGEQTLAMLAWLKKPHDAPNLLEKTFLSSVYAALNPSFELWEHYVEKIADLQGEGIFGPDDSALLVYSHQAHNALVDKTFGEASAFTEGTVAEVLAAAHEHLRQEGEERAEQRERELRQQLIDAELETERAQLQTIDTVTQLNSLSSTVERLARLREQTLKNSAARYARWVVRPAGVVFGVCVVAVALTGIPGLPFGVEDVRFGGSMAKGLWVFALACGVLGTIVAVLWGFGLVELIRAVEAKVAERLFKWLTRLTSAPGAREPQG